MNGIIYCAKAPDGQMYIGQTIDLLSVRKGGHKREAIRIGKLQPRDEPGFPESINEHGFKNIEWYILEDGIKSDAELAKIETYYIKHFDTFHNGLNLTEKGGGGARGKNNGMSKPVEVDGIKFDTMNDAAKYFNIGLDTIKNWINGGRRGSVIFGKNHPNAKPVEVDGIKFDTIRNAVKHFDVCPHTIKNWINGGRRGSVIFGKNHPNAKPVEVDGIKFDTMNDAAKYFNRASSTIYKWINGGKGSKNHKAKYL